MKAVLLIARNALRENLRRRIHYLILLFIVALLIMTESTSRFEAQVQLKMVKDFSYSIVSFFGLLVVLISTFDQIPSEVDSKTVYLPLSRPISRRTFIIGKYVGIIAVLTVFMLLMGAILGAIMYFDNQQKSFLLDQQLTQALYLLLLKYLSFASLLMLLSTVTSRPLAVTFSLFVYAYGHINDFMARAVANTASEGVFHAALKLLDFVLPKYSLLDLPGGLIYRESFSWSSMAILTVYASSFAALYLVLSIWTFSRKEL